MKEERCCVSDCERISFAQVGVPLASITESNKINYPYNNEEQELNVPIPLCPYHFALHSECSFGVFAVNMNDKCLIERCPEVIRKMEEVCDNELKQSIKDARQNPEKTMGIELARAMIKARKFELSYLKDMGHKRKEE